MATIMKITKEEIKKLIKEQLVQEAGNNDVTAQVVQRCRELAQLLNQVKTASPHLASSADALMQDLRKYYAVFAKG